MAVILPDHPMEECHPPKFPSAGQNLKIFRSKININCVEPHAYPPNCDFTPTLKSWQNPYNRVVSISTRIYDSIPLCIRHFATIKVDTLRSENSTPCRCHKCGLQRNKIPSWNIKNNYFRGSTYKHSRHL